MDEDDDADANPDEIVIVPMTMSFGVIALYIFLGSVLFGAWEGWEPLAAAYFSFITISTIGFGDLVPGSSNFATPAAKWKMVGCGVYMLIGMAIMSMAFSLIQDQISTKFDWICQKLGLLRAGMHSIQADDGSTHDVDHVTDHGISHVTDHGISHVTDHGIGQVIDHGISHVDQPDAQRDSKKALDVAVIGGGTKPSIGSEGIRTPQVPPKQVRVRQVPPAFTGLGPPPMSTNFRQRPARRLAAMAGIFTVKDQN